MELIILYIFWERFYKMCNAKGSKPNAIAKEIDISSGIITKWKTQGSLPNGETLIKIANHLNCSIDYLLGRVDDPAACDNEVELIQYFRQLNINGQEQAFTYTKNLSKIDEYKKCNDSENINAG